MNSMSEYVLKVLTDLRDDIFSCRRHEESGNQKWTVSSTLYRVWTSEFMVISKLAQRRILFCWFQNRQRSICGQKRVNLADRLSSSGVIRMCEAQPPARQITRSPSKAAMIMGLLRARVIYFRSKRPWNALALQSNFYSNGVSVNL
jgi:hypothetical protein